MEKVEISPAASALGKVSSGLFIVTTVTDEIKEGYLASWIQQTSFEPLMVSIAMKPGRPCYDSIKSQGRFCINIIGAKNGGVMKPFWSPKAGEDPFANLDFEISSRGNLILKTALAAIECEFRTSITPGDHEIIFAEVMEGHTVQLEDKPLTHQRKSALSY